MKNSTKLAVLSLFFLGAKANDNLIPEESQSVYDKYQRHERNNKIAPHHKYSEGAGND